ncbi:MAG: hypothetical protein D6766_10215 [Verrucomicrobia bacterium]|nr:MAG: hypothetical protein D6766_10215 [Verrucomicrobiota bacterium]
MNRPDAQQASTADRRLLLVDGHGEAYRAFHAFPALSAPDGAPTGALYGFVQAVERLLEGVAPDYFAVVWDGGLAEERTEALPEYKANRPPMPEELARQIDHMQAWLEARGCASLVAEGVEADDWIARLALAGREAGFRVLIATRDKDFMQLVDDRIHLLLPGRGAEAGEMGPEEVRRKTGVEPAQVVDWLSLMGDNSDNIPGAPGVGPKTAAKLLRQFGSLEGVYERLAEVTPERVRQALEAHRETVLRNRALVRLNPEVAREVPWEELQLRPPDAAGLRALYQRWGFRSRERETAGARQQTFF